MSEKNAKAASRKVALIRTRWQKTVQHDSKSFDMRAGKFAHAPFPDVRECAGIRQGPNIYIRTHITEVDINRDIGRFTHAYGYETNYCY
jgi:hypothetical protein